MYAKLLVIKNRSLNYSAFTDSQSTVLEEIMLNNHKRIDKETIKNTVIFKIMILEFFDMNSTKGLDLKSTVVPLKDILYLYLHNI